LERALEAQIIETILGPAELASAPEQYVSDAIEITLAELSRSNHTQRSDGGTQLLLAIGTGLLGAATWYWAHEAAYLFLFVAALFGAVAAEKYAHAQGTGKAIEVITDTFGRRGARISQEGRPGFERLTVAWPNLRQQAEERLARKTLASLDADDFS